MWNYTEMIIYLYIYIYIINTFLLHTYICTFDWNLNFVEWQRSLVIWFIGEQFSNHFLQLHQIIEVYIIKLRDSNHIWNSPPWSPKICVKIVHQNLYPCPYDMSYIHVYIHTYVHACISYIIFELIIINISVITNIILGFY